MYVVFYQLRGYEFYFFLSDINAYFMKKSNLKPSSPQYNFPFSIPEPTLKSKACLKCLYFTKIISDLCRYLEYFSYLYTINQTE